MKAIPIDGFCDFRFLSEIHFSPEGTNACLVVSSIDRKADEYKSYIYAYRGGRFSKLTGAGRESSFVYLDEDTILFPGKREDTKDASDKTDISSRWYRISLNGGEAELAYTFPVPVSKVMPLPDGDLVLTGSTFPGFEDLYTGSSKLIKAYRQHVKDNEDYEVIEQLPWWHNGGTFTRGSYTSLYYYSARTKKLRRLTAENVDVMQAELSPDKTSVYYLCRQVKPHLTITGENELCRTDLAGQEVKTLVRDRDDLSLAGICMGDNFAVVLASDNKYGINTDVDFYRLDYVTDEFSLITQYGEAVGTSVGTDLRYGGGQSCAMSGDTFYFVTTRWDGSFLYKLENGEISAVSDAPGSVDFFDVHEDKIMMVALRDMKGQEIYDGQGRQLSRFNSRVLSGKYVAQPEFLNVDRGGYDVHGWVLKPMDYEPGRKYPVILDVHGGPKTIYAPVYYHEMQYWAGKGYFVIFCNPTGSDGRGEFMDIRGKYGTVDFEDIMAFTDAALEAWPDMDRDNLFETGGSYGGFMTNWIVGHTDRFRAVASQRSISDWLSFWTVSDIGPEFVEDQNNADPWGDPAKLWEHSPLKYADRAKTPTLFIHAFEDYRCPIGQGYEMFAALIAHGVESKMVCFRGENHELSRSGKPSHRLRRLREITEWFENHRG